MVNISKRSTDYNGIGDGRGLERNSFERDRGRNEAGGGLRPLPQGTKNSVKLSLITLNFAGILKNIRSPPLGLTFIPGYDQDIVRKDEL